MSYSVVVLSSVAADNTDSLVKTGKCTSALENGNIVALTTLSTTAGESGVYLATTPATSTLETDIFYMVYEAPIPLVDSKYKGITDDPREFIIAANAIFNCYKPVIGDEIVLSTDGIAGTKSSNTMIIPANSTPDLTWGSSASGVSLAYTLKGTTFISIGSERVVAYKFICTKTL